MTSRIDLLAPATITVLTGSAAISSLDILPPDGISVTDPHAGGTIAITLIAANTAARLSASGAGGAGVSANANTLSVTGSQVQVNAALASLEISEAAGSTADTIMLTATDPSVLPGRTDIAVTVAANTGPAFATPPPSFALHPDSLTSLAGLVIGDPQAAGLAATGQGTSETMVLTLAVASGILLLPGFSAVDGVAAAGLGSGTIILDFTADRLNAVNALLAGLEYAGPAGTSDLTYALRGLTGPLSGSITSGNIALNIAGAASGGSFIAAGQTLVTAPVSLAAGSVLNIGGTLASLAGVTGAGAIFIGPDAALDLPYGSLALGGLSLDFGAVNAYGLTESGSLLLGLGADFEGAVDLYGTALVAFSGLFDANADATAANQLALSLVSGGVLAGNGTLLAGNFSEAGLISGPGTIADDGGTLLIAASSIGGSAVIESGGGDVVILGPVDPLYGVFDATPLTISSFVTLAFAGSEAAAPITGGYADALGQSGGVFVITGAQVFNGEITGFAAGDRLIFPGLSDIALYSTGYDSFGIAGLNSNSQTVTYTISTALPPGATPYVGTDNAGDAEISLRTSDDALLSDNTDDFGFTPGIAQPIQDATILLTAATSLSLTVTLSVADGVLSDGTLAPNSTLIITEANPAALDAALAGLSYTGREDLLDLLHVTSGTGVLAGLNASLLLEPIAAGTVNGFTSLTSEGEVAVFATLGLLAVNGVAAPGEVSVAATTDFADALNAGGISGTALLIDNNATGAFDTAAVVTLGANATIGDAGGAGTLAVLTDDFVVGEAGSAANVIIAASRQAAGSAAFVLGSLQISGSLVVGAAAAGTLDLAGGLGAAATSLGTSGSLLGFGGAAAAFGNLSDAGILVLQDHASASAGAATISGGLTLGGQAALAVQNAVSITAGTLLIGPDARLTAASLGQSGGTLLVEGTLALTGTLTSNAAVSLTGGSIAAGLSLGSAAVLAGAGVVAGGVIDAGTILASGGLLTLGGNIGNTGVIDIAANAALDAVHAVTGGTIDFTGTGAELTINDTGVFAAGVGNMMGQDEIDLIGDAPSLVSFSNGSITVTDTAGNALGGFTLGIAASQPAIQIIPDGNGGALITLGDEMPCFARGTRLLTPGGYRPVETLRPGEAIVTAAGMRRKLRWIGRRTLDFSNPKFSSARPVLIAPDAFGSGRPHRALRLSPLHAVYVDRVLVPAAHLVNGATITRDTVPAAVTYFHIELDQHDIVLADGLACESYFDTGNRGALLHELGTRAPARKACARLVTGGPELAAIRRRLHGIALASGFTLTYQPVLRAVTNVRTALPEITLRAQKRIARFTLPPDTRRITLLSRSASPADTDPESEDRRELALCLDAMQTGESDAPKLGAGWLDRAASDAGIWMGNTAEILFDRPAPTLTLSLAAVIQSWTAPAGKAGLRPAAGPKIDLQASSF